MVVEKCETFHSFAPTRLRFTTQNVTVSAPARDQSVSRHRTTLADQLLLTLGLGKVLRICGKPMPMNLVQLRLCLRRLGQWMQEPVVVEVPAYLASRNFDRRQNGLPFNVGCPGCRRTHSFRSAGPSQRRSGRRNRAELVGAR